jgi:hypothetical protein
LSLVANIQNVTHYSLTCPTELNWQLEAPKPIDTPPVIVPEEETIPETLPEEELFPFEFEDLEDGE